MKRKKKRKTSTNPWSERKKNRGIKRFHLVKFYGGIIGRDDMGKRRENAEQVF